MKQLPVWILIRGLCREQQHWGDFPEMLTRQLRQRCASHLLAPRPVLTLDLPGNGCLHDQESPATVPAMAEHLRQQVRQALAAQGMLYRLVGIAVGLGAQPDQQLRQLGEAVRAVAMDGEDAAHRRLTASARASRRRGHGGWRSPQAIATDKSGTATPIQTPPFMTN